jgi:hypothetical protein
MLPIQFIPDFFVAEYYSMVCGNLFSGGLRISPLAAKDSSFFFSALSFIILNFKTNKILVWNSEKLGKHKEKSLHKKLKIKGLIYDASKRNTFV